MFLDSGETTASTLRFSYLNPRPTEVGLWNVGDLSLALQASFCSLLPQEFNSTVSHALFPGRKISNPHSLKPAWYSGESKYLGGGEAGLLPKVKRWKMRLENMEDWLRRPNICLIGVPDRKNIVWREAIFEKIIIGCFSNQRKTCRCVLSYEQNKYKLNPHLNTLE